MKSLVRCLSNQFAWIASVLLVTTSVLSGQTTSLALTSTSALAGGSATISVALTSQPGQEPAGLQWTFTYPPGSIATWSVASGPALTASGKSLQCAPSA